MSMDVFSRQGILTEPSQLPDHLELLNEKWVVVFDIKYKLIG